MLRVTFFFFQLGVGLTTIAKNVRVVIDGFDENDSLPAVSWQVLVLDVIPPEKIPGRVVPRVGVRDRAAPPAAAAAAAAGGSTVGIDTASPSRKPHGGMADSVQTLGGGDSKASKGRSLDESVKDKEGVGVGSVGGAAGGGEEGELEKAGRGRRPLRKGGAAARRKRGSRSERFFEMSATSQVKVVPNRCFYGDGVTTVVVMPFDNRLVRDKRSSRLWLQAQTDAASLLKRCRAVRRQQTHTMPCAPPCSPVPSNWAPFSLSAPCARTDHMYGPAVVSLAFRLAKAASP